ncbi:hypothetical protein BTN49_2966 [Candidatus Enterovibrio escicola]|uniref:Uncharacterized protein n=1 Tax=Candidatus Enterovibrio escicola TaxID=1927127 RepID=A0A2A5SZS9_9GAMM|nr:hypothetical protein BTN49_2966 [Candidatus Enterovibrio escacola]
MCVEDIFYLGNFLMTNLIEVIFFELKSPYQIICMLIQPPIT